MAVVGAGQAGLAVGRALQQAGLGILIVEAAAEVGGSWPSYYDSLTLFSPARFSAPAGMRLPGRPGRYPNRDEVTDYLRGYAARFDLPVRTRSRVGDVAWDGHTFQLALPGGDRLAARAVVAASGGFGRPHVPDLPGLTGFTGRLLHAAGYRRPEPFAGRRVVVVGAGNSAVQIAVELAQVATVSLASREPVRFRPQRPLGMDVHYWARWSGLEALPIHRDGARSVGVLDYGRYAAAFAAGRPDRRPMFDRLTPTGVVWSDGTASRSTPSSSPPATGPTSATSPASAPSTTTAGRSTAAAAASPSPARLRRAARPDRAGLGHGPRRRRRRPPDGGGGGARPRPQARGRSARPGRLRGPRPRRPGGGGLDALTPHARTDRVMRDCASRVLAEAVGTGLLVSAVVGSGIAASRLSPDDVGLQLLENALITGAALVALILALQPVSAAFNPS